MGSAAKALIGAVTAGLTALATAMTDGSVTGSEWIGVALAALGTLGAVYGIANKPTEK